MSHITTTCSAIPLDSSYTVDVHSDHRSIRSPSETDEHIGVQETKDDQSTIDPLTSETTEGAEEVTDAASVDEEANNQSESENENMIKEERFPNSWNDEEDTRVDESSTLSPSVPDVEMTSEVTHVETENTEMNGEETSTSEHTTGEESDSVREEQEESTAAHLLTDTEGGEEENQVQNGGEDNRKRSTKCGGEITTEHGELQSPNFPDNYPPDQECIWLLTAAEDSHFVLKFNSLDMHASWTGCYDYLEMRDGHSEDGDLIGSRLCGGTVPEDMRSQGNKLFIKFVSDSSPDERSGFSLSFRKQPNECTDCDNELIQEEKSEATAASELASTTVDGEATEETSEAQSEKIVIDGEESTTTNSPSRKDEEVEDTSHSSTVLYEEDASVAPSADEENEVISESVSNEGSVNGEDDTSSGSLLNAATSDSSTESISDVSLESREEASNFFADPVTEEHVITTLEGNNLAESVESTTQELTNEETTDESACDCPSGFRAVCNETDECEDIDECIDENRCEPGRYCYNSPGGFICIPHDDISDETCFVHTDCRVGSKCLNINASYKCVLMDKNRLSCSHSQTCQAGYICQDNECVKRSCGENEKRSDTGGHFTCICEDGFERDSSNACVDIDECSALRASLEDLCIGGTCINTVGGHSCICDAGYQNAEGTCVDIDECRNGSHNCTSQEDCANEPGTYHCESAEQSMLSNDDEVASSSILISLNVSLAVICIVLNFIFNLIKL